MRALIIEDENEIAVFLKNGLEAECFAVDVSNDGEQGLWLGQTNDYDLIILDYLLPGKNGREICEALRKEGKNTPIIMLTVKSELEDKVDLLEIGADDYLTKPFSFAELLARIKAVLRRPADINERVLQVGDLVLDAKSHTAKREGRVIYLTRKEYIFLEYLMKNQGVVLSRSRIMEHVWDVNADPFSNTIESHILNLRKKVDQHSRQKLIHTIQGRGYMISAE